MSFPRRIFTQIALVTGLSLTLGSALAQTYPTRPVSLVVPFAAGGPTDIVARALATGMAGHLGQPVVVVNRPGAGGTLAAGYVARAEPNGYTFLIHHNGMATAPALHRRLPYNPLTDFEFVGQVVNVPMTLLGRRDLPPNTLPELISYVRANAGRINLANAGPGAVSHLCGMLFQSAVGVNLTTVPFAGTAPALTALLGGHVDLLCDQTTQTLPHIRAGAVKLYGVTTTQRIRALPDVPTLSEGGLRGFEVVVWHGVYAPRGTPAAVVQRFGDAMRAALREPAFASRMAELGAELVPVSEQTPEGLRNWLQSEINKWGPLIRAAGVFAD